MDKQTINHSKYYYDFDRNKPYQSTNKKQLKRIENYDKVLPILELYRCVQSEGSRFVD